MLGSFMLRLMNRAHRNLYDWALENTNIKENFVVLDVGCGGGKTIQLLSKNNILKTYGIDYSEQAVKSSIRANKKDVETGKVIIQQASVTDIPFSDNFFDVVTAFQTHYFWSDLEKSVKEVLRVLKRNGSFIIAAELDGIHYHMKAYKSQEEMENLFRKVGFSNVQFITKERWICIKGIK